jgi:thymidylate synthase
MTTKPYFGELLHIKNPESSIGIVTLWTKKERVMSEVKEDYAVMGQLYSREEGISALVRNCLMNKKIHHIIVTGVDLYGSGEALIRLFKDGVDTNHKIIGVENAFLDKEIPKSAIDNLRKHVTIHDLRKKGFSEIDPLIKSLPKFSAWGEPEVFPKAKIEMPDAFPSDRIAHKIRERYIGEAWLKILYNVMRFGYHKSSKYADDIRELLNLSTVITEEDPDNPRLEEYFNFSQSDLDNYIPQVTTPKCVEGVLYTYGQRLRNFKGIDQIQFIIDFIKKEKDSRRLIAFTWDVVNDINAPHAPCIDMVHVLVQDKLYMTVYIRSNDMFNAWPKNAYALRKLQSIISEAVGIEMGSLTIISGSAHIYATDFKKTLALLEKYPPTLSRVGDPRGNILVRVENNEIVVTHLDPNGHRIDQFSGKSAMELYRKMATEMRVSEINHAFDIGCELQKAEIALSLGIPYVQDQPLDFKSK